MAAAAHRCCRRCRGISYTDRGGRGGGVNPQGSRSGTSCGRVRPLCSWAPHPLAVERGCRRSPICPDRREGEETGGGGEALLLGDRPRRSGTGWCAQDPVAAGSRERWCPPRPPAPPLAECGDTWTLSANRRPRALYSTCTRFRRRKTGIISWKVFNASAEFVVKDEGLGGGQPRVVGSKVGRLEATTTTTPAPVAQRLVWVRSTPTLPTGLAFCHAPLVVPDPTDGACTPPHPPMRLATPPPVGC